MTVQDRSCLVTYLPSHPEIHCLGPADRRLQSHNQTAYVLAVTLAVVFSILFLGFEFHLHRELSLARYGEVAAGQIVDKTSHTWRKRTVYRLRYLFDAPDGAQWGWLTVGECLWGYLAHGAAITVLYDPDDPSRHRPSFGFRFVQFLAETEEEGLDQLE